MMRLKLSRGRRAKVPVTDRATQVKLSGEDLAALARFVMAGRVLLQADYPPVVARLKAAMTRLGVAAPKGF